MIGNADAQWFNAVARLRPGVETRQAAAQANASLRSFRADRNRSRRARARPVRSHRADTCVAGTGSAASSFLRSAVCDDAGDRDSPADRVREPRRPVAGTRRDANGASSPCGWRRAPGSGRLLRQVLTETLVLFVLGAAAGLLVAYVAIEGADRILRDRKTTDPARRAVRLASDSSTRWASRSRPACSRACGQLSAPCGSSRRRR